MVDLGTVAGVSTAYIIMCLLKCAIEVGNANHLSPLKTESAVFAVCPIACYRLDCPIPIGTKTIAPTVTTGTADFASRVPRSCMGLHREIRSDSPSRRTEI